ncbi:MAG: type II toxin-antitoxin system VapC family toxin [Promethearchaeota archaeon]
MVILDTDLIIKILRGKPSQAIDIYKFLVKHQVLLKTTIFTYSELYEGAYLSQNVPKSLDFLENFLGNFKIIPFSNADGKKFGQIQAILTKNGTPIGDFDVAIATIAINNDEILLSRNKTHFEKIPMLKFRNWDDRSWDRREIID